MFSILKMLGFDQPKNLGARESGARAALPIWINYMEVALNGKPENTFEMPENIITAWVNQTTGDAVALLASGNPSLAYSFY